MTRNRFAALAVILAATVSLGTVAAHAIDSHMQLTPKQAVQQLPECTPAHDHDCYVIDSNGELYVL